MEKEENESIEKKEELENKEQTVKEQTVNTQKENEEQFKKIQKEKSQQKNDKQEKSKERTKTKESKGAKVVKVLLIIFAILVVITLANFTRNYFIISEISEITKQYENLNNFSYTISEEGTGGKTEFYIRDGIIKAVFYRTDGSKFTVWKDNVLNKGMIVDEDKKTAVVGEGDNIVMSVVELPYTSEFREDNKNIMSLINMITTKTVNGKECYDIKNMGGTLEIWVDKETGLPLKAQNGTQDDILVESNRRIPLIYEYSNWIVNGVTDEMVARPDVTGYTISEINENS